MLLFCFIYLFIWGGRDAANQVPRVLIAYIHGMSSLSYVSSCKLEAPRGMWGRRRVLSAVHTGGQSRLRTLSQHRVASAHAWASTPLSPLRTALPSTR